MNETFQYFQLITNIIVIILFVGLTVLAFKIMGLVNSLKTKVDDLTGKVNGVVQDIKPVIEKVNGVVDTVQNIAGKVNDNIDVLDGVVVKVKDTVDNIVEFEQRIQMKITPPIDNTIQTYSAIVKGVMAFIDRFKSFKSSRISHHEFGEESSFVEDAARGFENEFQKEYEDINRELNEVREKLEEMRK